MIILNSINIFYLKQNNYVLNFLRELVPDSCFWQKCSLTEPKVHEKQATSTGEPGWTTVFFVNRGGGKSKDKSRAI